MDEHDHDEPNLSSHNSASNDPDQFFEPAKERFKKFDTILQVPDIQLVPPSIEKMLQIHPVQDDQYNGESLLHFSHQHIPIHDDLKKPNRVKRMASLTVSYQRPLHPPHTDDTVDTKDVTPSALICNQISK